MSHGFSGGNKMIKAAKIMQEIAGEFVYAMKTRRQFNSLV